MKRRLLSLYILLHLFLLTALPAWAETSGSVSNAMNAVARVYTEGIVERYIDGRLVERGEHQPYATGSAFAVGGGVSLIKVGKQAPPIPTTPAVLMRLTISSGVSSG